MSPAPLSVPAAGVEPSRPEVLAAAAPPPPFAAATCSVSMGAGLASAVPVAWPLASRASVLIGSAVLAANGLMLGSGGGGAPGG